MGTNEKWGIRTLCCASVHTSAAESHRINHFFLKKIQFKVLAKIVFRLGQIGANFLSLSQQYLKPNYMNKL